MVARLLKATSNFGAEFDSMSDLISFGVAPSMLVLNAGIELGGVEVGSGQFWVLAASCGAFALAGAMRLARFNLANDTPSTGWFTGVPITVAGGGGSLEDFDPANTPFGHKKARYHHLAYIAVNGDYLEFQAIDEHGRLFDVFSLYKRDDQRRHRSFSELHEHQEGENP